MNDIVVFGHPSLTSKSENIINIDDYVVNLSKKIGPIKISTFSRNPF